MALSVRGSTDVKRKRMRAISFAIVPSAHGISLNTKSADSAKWSLRSADRRGDISDFENR